MTYPTPRLFRSLGLAGALLVATGCSAADSKPAPVSSAPGATVTTDLFTGTGKAPVHTYRIPSLCVTKKGTLLAFAELRKANSGDSGDIDTVVRRSTDGGKTWSKDKVVLDLDKYTVGNACPLVDAKTGRITVVAVWNRLHEYKVRPGFGDDSRLVYLTHSDNDGLTWSKPEDISKEVKQPEWGWMATGPGAGIVKKLPPHAGRYIVGVNHNLPADKGAYYAHALFSDDSGKTWKSSTTFGSRGTNECEIVELSNGDLMLNMRNQGTGRRDRAVSISKDAGETWGPTTYDKQLPEPVCQGAILRHSWPHDGKPGLILFVNPASKKGRQNLILRGSYDDGKTWSVQKVIDPGAAAYSHLAILPNGDIALAYEPNGSGKIVLTIVKPEELSAEAAPSGANPALEAKPQKSRSDYDWMKRHAAILALKDKLNPEVIMVGDSITHRWAGLPDAGPAYGEHGAAAWKTLFGDRPVLNIGFGADRTQNLLWRLEHGEIDGLRPKWVVLNIGTNNLVGGGAYDRACTPAEVVVGVGRVVSVIREKVPGAKVVVMGVFPRDFSTKDSFREKISEINSSLKDKYAGVTDIVFLDIGEQLLRPDGSLTRDIMPDGLHPSEKGYAIWGAALSRLMAGN